MDDEEFEVAESEALIAFKARLRAIQGARTDGDMADLLGVPLERYKKWKTRPKSGFPMFKLPKLAKIAGKSLEEIITGPKPVIPKKNIGRKHGRAA